MAQAAYKLPDEPSPGILQNLVVNPLWPLLAIMFVGAWLALPWFVFNAFAIGSPTRIKELFITVAGWLGIFLLAVVVMKCFEVLALADSKLKYGLQFVVIAKLGVAYWLYFLQSRTFEIYEHFNGRVRNGLLVVIAAAIFLRKDVLSLVDNVLWVIVVA
jgi:hypothetical protein